VPRTASERFSSAAFGNANFNDRRPKRQADAVELNAAAVSKVAISYFRRAFRSLPGKDLSLCFRIDEHLVREGIEVVPMPSRSEGGASGAASSRFLFDCRLRVRQDGRASGSMLTDESHPSAESNHQIKG
jgi:hypothetical protein